MEPRISDIPIKKQPSFLIVGALKAGTTTLANVLEDHPEIGIPVKEIHFFDGKLEMGQDWYEYQFGSCSANIVGEATPTYGFHPQVPQLISQMYPDIKIIWILRDPIKRAYSNWIHCRKHFIEKRSFTDAVNDEISCKNSDRWTCYLERSLYVEQIYRYLRYFDQNRIHVVTIEELIMDFAYGYKHLLKFLDVNDHNFKTKLIQSNITEVPKYMRLQEIIKNSIPLQLVPDSVKRLWPRDPAPNFDNTDLKDILTDYFEPANIQLEELIGKHVRKLWS